MQSWHGFGLEIWKPGLALGLVTMRDTYCIILVIFFVTTAQQRLFLVQTGVMGKAKQRSRAAVGRIPAGVGSVPKPAARERQECSGT